MPFFVLCLVIPSKSDTGYAVSVHINPVLPQRPSSPAAAWYFLASALPEAISPTTRVTAARWSLSLTLT